MQQNKQQPQQPQQPQQQMNNKQPQQQQQQSAAGHAIPEPLLQAVVFSEDYAKIKSKHRREMTELQKRHNDEYAKLMLKVRTLQPENTTAVPDSSRDTGEANMQSKRRDEAEHQERRTISRHGSQELLDYQPNESSKKDKKDSTTENSRKIDLEEMYKQQLDLMGIKQDSKAPKPDVKPSKPSLNELKLKKQAEQMNTKQSGATTNDASTERIGGDRTPTPQRKVSVPTMPSQNNQQNETNFFDSLTGLNLSQLLHQYEVKERRNKSKTAPVQSAALMAAVAEASQTNQQQQHVTIGQTTHYNTIGASDSHVTWTHNDGQILQTPSEQHPHESQQQFYQNLFQQKQQQQQMLQTQQLTTTTCPQQTHEQAFPPGGAAGANIMSSSWPNSGQSMFTNRSQSLNHLDNIPTQPGAVNAQQYATHQQGGNTASQHPQHQPNQHNNTPVNPGNSWHWASVELTLNLV